MSPDPDYPRWMFHRSLHPVIVESREQEAALGAEWSRTLKPAPPDEPAQVAAAPKRGRGRPPHYPEVGNVQR